MKKHMPQRWFAWCLLACCGSVCLADEHESPPLGRFPAAGAGVYLTGELVAMDHVNRRGALRLIGDGDKSRYHSGPSHEFAMLPYGSIRYRGAPAELRDVPIGTLLHGRFLTPPPDGSAALLTETRAKPAPAASPKSAKPAKPTLALSLEDDFSYRMRVGQAWRIASVDLKAGKLKANTPATADPGLSGEKVFTIDDSTRIWKGRELGALSDVKPELAVQLSLTWAPDWQNGEFHIADVWVDEASRNVATEQQRRIHIRHQKTRWLAGWVDQVEHGVDGRGIVTVTLFGGMDASLYDEVRAKKGHGMAVAAGEPTLRTWWHHHDHKWGHVLQLTDLPNPPPGSSGLQLRMEIRELLEGYRPGRIVRLRCHDWPNVKLPPEERIKSMDER